MAARQTKTRTYDWADLAEFYRAAVRGQVKSDGELGKLAAQWRRGGDWRGGDAEAVIGRLDRGYDFPAGAAPSMPVALDGMGPAWSWNDHDGDYEHDQWLAGEDYYLERRLEPARPGIHIRARMDFVSNVDAEVMAAYGAWVGSAVEAIQAQGFDISLNVTAMGSDKYMEDSSEQKYVIRVTRFGETLLARDFAVLFTPAGDRHLIFAAHAIPEVREGLHLTPGLGGASSGSWGVEFDEDTRVLNFDCNPHAFTFPADDMTAMLHEIQGQL